MGRKSTKGRNKKNKKALLLTVLFFIIGLFIVYGAEHDLIDTVKIADIINYNGEQIEEINASKPKDKGILETVTNTDGNEIKIYFFDVDQADSILLVSNNETMLIDAGTNETGKRVVENIEDLGITKIDYLVGTHPHEDHIGGLDDVIKSFEIGNIYMPKIQANTKTFEDVLDVISAKGKKVTAPKQGDVFSVGDVKCEVMLCGSGTQEEQKENLNLSSIVIRAEYGEQSYLFTGDAESQNESSREWPQTTVLKVGHHGSNTSTSAKFLSQVKPQIAIIQCGANNKYGHPKEITLNKLKKIGAKIYRTDQNGTIVLTSDGTENKIVCEK